ncbi:hypothetical protein L2735_12970 [Shewanella olleyana]|uniref:hypothetical protein n=1 Tax=Shewanella olleyana TaxID=135626 RepID=UPI00200BAA18|nr:hypothetical protein [Shewanella olleyana]MCL1067704.1 hypothetical protein [Shewanella olleyana]
MTNSQIKTSKGAFRNPYKGFYSIWIRDFGSLSFLVLALLGLGLTALTLLTQPEKVEMINLTLGMTILSVSTSVAWQFIKLTASEHAVLIPHYRTQVMVQSISVFILMSLICYIVFESTEQKSIGVLMLFFSIGMGFIYACLIKPQRFNLSVFVFVFIPLAPEVIVYLPEAVVSYLVLLPVLLGFLIDRQLLRLSWNDDARAIYLNGIETGWMIGPIAGQNRWFMKLSRYLHPASYFVGPMLGMILIAAPILSVAAIFLSAYMEADIPVLMVLSQLIIMASCLIHWTRVQRWRSAETLYMLPNFSGKTGLISQFFNSQLRLLAVVIVIMSLISLISAQFNSQITLMVGLHVVACTTWASGLALAFGCMSRSVLQVSFSMLVVIFSSVWLSTSLVTLREDNGLSLGYYWGDLGLLLLMAVLLVISKNKLWKNGVACL